MNILSLLLLTLWSRQSSCSGIGAGAYPRRLPAAPDPHHGRLLRGGLGDLFGFWDYASRQGTLAISSDPGSDQAVLQSLTQDLEGLVATIRVSTHKN